jgi:hypothetical protein
METLTLLLSDHICLIWTVKVFVTVKNMVALNTSLVYDYDWRFYGPSQTLSDPFVKLSDVQRKPSDILSDLSDTEVYCLSDPCELVSDRTVALSNETENVADGERNGEVENKLLKCRHLTVVTGMQVNSGLEISMNDTNYLISSQHLPFRINTLR